MIHSLLPLFPSRSQRLPGEIREGLTPTVLSGGLAQIRPAVETAFQRTDQGMLAAAQVSGVVGADPSTSTFGGATVAVAVIVAGHPVYVAHAGDAR